MGGVSRFLALIFILCVGSLSHALECDFDPKAYDLAFYQVDVAAEQGDAPGVVGPTSYAKHTVISAINDYPHFLFALVNNRYFPIQVTELVICQENGTRFLVDPRTGEPSAVKAVPMLNDFGGIVGVDMTLPPEGVLFRSQNGVITSYEGMAVHEARHAHQINLGLFGTHTDMPDLVAAENDAQAIENRVTGNNLSYFEDKHGDRASFFDSQGDLEQRRTRVVIVPCFVAPVLF